MVEVVWWRWCGGGGVVWWKWCGGGGVVEVVWWRWCGRSGVVEVVWWCVGGVCENWEDFKFLIKLLFFFYSMRDEVLKI